MKLESHKFDEWSQLEPKMESQIRKKELMRIIYETLKWLGESDFIVEAGEDMMRITVRGGYGIAFPASYHTEKFEVIGMVVDYMMREDSWD